MYHSITFGDKNTWTDWHLIPTTRPVVNPPEVKTNYVSVLATDGDVDLSELLANRTLYENRKGSFTFAVENDHKSWELAYSEILNYLHGKRMKLILEDDPNYYYVGRFSVNEWRSDKWWSTIVIDYVVGPYKYPVSMDGEDWLWDPFSFETGVIPDAHSHYVDGTYEVHLIGGVTDIVPEFISTGSLSVTKDGITKQLIPGPNKFDDIKIKMGENVFVFTGTGTVRIWYVGGIL